jgi:deoxyadenosine/deoxycytidine kinase
MAASESKPQPFVVVAGNIATGKTALAKILAKRLGGRSLREQVGANPYFERFYDDPPAWAFPSQLSFGLDSLRRHISALDGQAVVQDRSVYETVEVFGAHLHARGFLSDEQLKTLSALGDCAFALPRQPSLLIYLRAEIDELLDRIVSRGRPAESGIAADYLADLNALYKSFAQNWTLSPVVTIDTGTRDLREPQEIAHLFEEVLRMH